VQCGSHCGIKTFVEMALTAALCLTRDGLEAGRQNCHRTSPGRPAGWRPDVLPRCIKKSAWLVFFWLPPVDQKIHFKKIAVSYRVVTRKVHA
jgi:hypothetical protein